MSESPNLNPENKKFGSPEEELAFLRGEIRAHEQNLERAGERPIREAITSARVREYEKRVAGEVLDKKYILSEAETAKIVLDLVPEEHDKKMEELAGILQTKGIKNALYVADKLNDEHLYDDFHRFLVQYIKAGFDAPGLKEKSPLGKSLRATLFEISLPESGKEEEQKDLKKLISGMEQFYAGMLAVSAGDKSDKDNTFTLEIADANHSDEFIFYASVPDSKKNLFEKQILSLFPKAKVIEKKDDYNIFNETGVSVGSFAKSGRNSIFPLKIYEHFETDPLNVLLNSFSKIDKNGEGAAIQFVFSSQNSDWYLRKYKHALEEIRKGVPVKRAIDIREGFWGEVSQTFGDFLKEDKKTDKEKKEPPIIDEKTAEQIRDKVGSQILECNIRIIASSQTKESATEILADLEASFNQFENTHGNKLEWERLNGGKLSEMLHNFSFRTFEKNQKLILNAKELTTMMHFPSSVLRATPQLKSAKAGTSSAPVGLPTAGILLGVNRDRNSETKIFMEKEDRLRHFYTVGQTGTGKTTLFKNMIAQDIWNGEGVCMIDPHGVDIDHILSVIPPERFSDVIYFDPGAVARPMALNMLEYDERFPEQKTFVVNEMLSIFDKLFDMKTAGGPMFEQYFRNSVMLVIDDPASGNTLLDVSRVLSNKAFRDLKLSRCKNPITVQFWKEVAEKAGGEASLANIVPYITSKFDNFLSNEIMRPIIAQEKSSWSFREAMDSRKILLVNLAKGRLGDINSHLIGLILVGKILMAALSRVDSFGKDLPNFYLYIDEFQNVTTNSISTILSEARKYKLGLNIAHQFIKQLDEKIKDSVFGNVGTIASFRVGAEDAEYLEKQFAPVFSARDIMNLDNRNAYLKLLVGGRPMKPFNIETLPPPAGLPENISKLKELSHLKYGRPRAEVEAEILGKYQNRV